MLKEWVVFSLLALIASIGSGLIAHYYAPVPDSENLMANSIITYLGGFIGGLVFAIFARKTW